MKAISVKILFIIAVFDNGLFCQNKSLDSLINKVVGGQSRIIILKNDTVYSITNPYKKINYVKTDSLVKINFENRSRLSLKKKDFWGIVTDFEERRRYYKDEIYIIWRTKKPYIYLELKNRNTNHYFFSESLTSNIYKLNELNIDGMVNDSITKRILKTFYRNNKIDLVKHYDYSSCKNEKIDIGAIIEITAEILDFLYSKKSSHKNTFANSKQYIYKDPTYKVYQQDSSLYK